MIFVSIFIGNLFNWWSVSLEGRLAVFDSIIMSIWILIGRLAVLDRIILFIWILVSRLAVFDMIKTPMWVFYCVYDILNAS